MLSKEEITMKKYTKPAIEVVELSVKESLSALPTGFRRAVTTRPIGETTKTVTIYKKGSAPISL